MKIGISVFFSGFLSKCLSKCKLKAQRKISLRFVLSLIRSGFEIQRFFVVATSTIGVCLFTWYLSKRSANNESYLIDKFAIKRSFVVLSINGRELFDFKKETVQAVVTAFDQIFVVVECCCCKVHDFKPCMKLSLHQI